ncbi:sodium:alanine symporter family protein [uncultured Clostridium sp.]|jgi:amino acid carrier protein|uniref:alanine/glycine:cation symporter family protein n=1 Tax=uncultured Clostridium sp. TaxID=59620 RepID=UPI00266596A1|nr:sodium:alanine symporter family protein [uncultured Clostridium sp.]
MVKNIYFGDFLLQIVLILIRLNRDRLISKWQSGLNLVEYCKVIKKEVEERTVETIVKINEVVNGIVWGVPIMLLILGTGIYYTIRFGFIQFRHPVWLVKQTIVKVFQKKDEGPTVPGELTSFQAAMTSVSAIVGSGNIAGAATAIVMGGPGALIWMILAAFVGMATKFAEIALGVKYRKVHEDGTVSGGAMYYLSEGLHQKWLGMVFSILVIPFAFVISGIVDTNTIALTLNERYSVPTLATGIVLAVVVGIIVFGGIGRIGHVCEVVAPFMGGAYILAGLLIILVHITQVPGAITEIFTAAFNPKAATGGIVGSVFVCMRYGIARGIYSNEAGLGTAAMVHCGAKVNDPIEQAVWGPVEVFLDTVFICSVTGIAIVLSGLWNSGLDGAVLTMRAFDQLLPGGIGGFICLASVVLFGFSCLVSYYTYAERAGEYIFGKKVKPVIKIFWVIVILIGSQSTLGFAWDLADTFNGLMIIPNLIGIIFLSNEAVKMKNDFFKKNVTFR